uniref:Jacalin-type lectin domain-containing protein n=1 Tax=Pseudictyota dubia TaxID=2749911 RepID=A0A7R9VGK7_9STRA|mmetsp:Transcript_1306/g.2150  ORF Transcript_1306/g.2150 Transcript_1306/m.2150 type:complete len:421 (+) Transcript_1306:165-1427(+)|eukprot:CAMPEP_0197449048 /NCGR_PEP_ID=MMETSP1175-20131217/20032_1 /TAXON_ID=1003142 /ORGANISM="Triceratium dubium, Strain CCMP147" /LENGTH=420 /DNA_ID=CAMNT_0042981039 /DNA_START=151 /DNA_END=1413 /DNA_ORIENTATION=+
MTPKETGSVEDDWSAVSGEGESADSYAPPAEVWAEADYSAPQPTEESGIEEGTEVNEAEDGLEKLALEEDGRGEGSGADSEKTVSETDVDGNRTSPPSVGVVPSADSTEDGVDVDAISVAELSAGKSETPAMAETTQVDEDVTSGEDGAHANVKAKEEEGNVSGREDAIDSDADVPPGTISSAGSEASGTQDRDEVGAPWTNLNAEEFDVPNLTDWTQAMLYAGKEEETDNGPEVVTKEGAAELIENLATFGGGGNAVDANANAVPKTTSHAGGKYGVTTKLFGGRGGGPFNDTARPYCRINSIAVNAGALIDGISVMYSDGTTTKHGGEGGGWHSIPLVGGESIVEVSVRYGRFVQSLTFLTNMGRTFGPYGEGGFVLGLGPVREATVKAPEGHILGGIHGRRGKYIDGIGFHWAPAVM